VHNKTNQGQDKKAIWDSISWFSRHGMGASEKDCLLHCIIAAKISNKMMTRFFTDTEEEVMFMLIKNISSQQYLLATALSKQNWIHKRSNIKQLRSEMKH
jgi:hypothetical protein